MASRVVAGAAVDRRVVLQAVSVAAVVALTAAARPAIGRKADR